MRPTFSNPFHEWILEYVCGRERRKIETMLMNIMGSTEDIALSDVRELIQKGLIQVEGGAFLGARVSGSERIELTDAGYAALDR